MKQAQESARAVARRAAGYAWLGGKSESYYYYYMGIKQQFLMLFMFIMLINIVLNVVLKGGDRDA